MNKYVKTILGKVRWKMHALGYDVRKNEEHCWPDQRSLLGDVDAPMIFDIGANAGLVAERYRQMFSKARIHCFEPMPKTCAIIRERFASDSQISVHQAAVTSECNPCTFTVNAASDTSSLYAADVDAIPTSYQHSMAAAETITVPGITIDSFCQNEGVTKIDILKLDIQGGELGALKGAAAMLESQSISVIYSEAFFLPFYKEQPLFGDITAYLNSHNYHFHGLYNPTFSGQTGRLQWADCIFVNASLREASGDLQRQAMRA